MKKMKKNVRKVEETTKALFDKKGERGRLSKVHDWTHVSNVAGHAEAIAKALSLHEGMSEEEAERVSLLSKASGCMHDWRRDAKERGQKHGPKMERLVEPLAKRYPDFVEGVKKDEIAAVAKAIGLHELSFKGLEEKLEGASQLEKIIARSLVAADKGFEASGSRVIERRTFFVGKERMREEKDLHYLHEEYGEKAPLCAVAMESLMRLRARNEISTYPDWLKPIVKPLHAKQEEFYHGLLNHLGYNSEHTLLDEMKRIDFPKTKNLKKMLDEHTPKEKVTVDTDTQASAVEIVNHYVTAGSPEKATETFEPRGSKAKEWQGEIQAYHDRPPSYLEKLVTQINENLKQA